MEINNRKATYNYFIENTYEAGIALKGTEIKSIREGSANLQDSYAVIRKNEVFLLNMYVSHYKEGNQFNHEERRTRKLLLHKNEILKISNKINTEGYTLIPLKLYFKRNKVKILLGLAKGKKIFDKRETIKKRDLEREARKEAKYSFR
ncbi:MAG: SsrA-binding protein SmpB [Bacilli bacterium]|nr:SsrA-binding protein SmpB [Bacilli bacterium]MDD3304686.1 SsrA-binding protein SmpB [Bacilli bacterium]MDD4053262.1 SsrA-binding protein SmpB [Bacilli bacterium]MDD4411398.1 SsrA-binding protein SmpB [Bacilli bacterium]